MVPRALRCDSAELDRGLRGLESFGYSGATIVANEGGIVLEKG